jgi:riboflavin biosynthesis pyrimidine reductase
MERFAETIIGRGTGLLSEQEAVTALQGDTVARVLVIGGETSRVSRLGDLAVNNLLQRVDTLAIGAQGVLFKRVSYHVGRGGSVLAVEARVRLEIAGGGNIP